MKHTACSNVRETFEAGTERYTSTHKRRVRDPRLEFFRLSPAPLFTHPPPPMNKTTLTVLKLN